MKQIDLGKISLPVDGYASQGNAILGIRDSGKSFAATFMAEHLMDAGVPIVAFDPIGIWRFLRVAGKGAGFPVVVAGGEHGDLPLTPQSAPAIVRAAMQEGVSLVIDLYSMELSKRDWCDIVAASVKVLLYENKPRGLRHIFIEESAEFAPQNVRPDQGAVYDVIERLGRMGGNALLGYTLINQRAEQVNKAVLELCDNLFLFRQKGKNSLLSLSKWLGVADAQGGKEIVASLPLLGQGECWAWIAGTDTPVRVKVPAKRTFHPDRRAMHSAALPAQHKAIDVSAFVEHMSGALAEIVKEAEENDPKALKATIRELEGRLASSSAPSNEGEKQEAAEELDRLQADNDNLAAMLDEMEKERDGLKGELETERAGAEELRTRLQDIGKLAGVVAPVAQRQAAPVPAGESWRQRRAPVAPAPRQRRETVAPAAPSAGLTGPQQKILDGLAELEAVGASAPRRILVANMAGYSHVNSTGFAKALSALSAGGMVAYQGGAVALTSDGRRKAHRAKAPLTTAALQERIMGLLSGPGQLIFRAVVARYPRGLDREQLAHAVGYQHVNSTGFAKALSRMRSLGFVDYQGGNVVASPVLFLEGVR